MSLVFGEGKASAVESVSREYVSWCKGRAASNKSARALSRLGSLSSSVKPEKGDTRAKATKSKAGASVPVRPPVALTSWQAPQLMAAAVRSLGAWPWGDPWLVLWFATAALPIGM